MGFVNQKIARLKPSETLAVKTKANELRAAGREVWDLSTGEPDIDTPDHIKEAACQAMRDGKTKYTAVAGIPELRKAIAEKLQTENKLLVDPNQVIVTAGGKHALYALFDSIVEAGDEIIIFSPYWVSYLPMIEMAGGVPIVLSPEADTGLRIKPAQLRKALSPKTKAVVFNSPSNPTGVGYNREQLIEFGHIMAESRALIVSDEVYEKTAYPHFSFCSFGDACPELQDRLVTVNAFSKSYSMTGWRVGYAAGPSNIIAAMERHQSQATSNVCSIAQYAALGALKGPHDFLNQMNDNFARRIALARETISTTPGLELRAVPDGAFYLFIHFDKEQVAAGKYALKGSTELVKFFLDKGGVATVQGEAFGDDSAFRVSMAASDRIVSQGIRAITECMRELMEA